MLIIDIMLNCQQLCTSSEEVNNIAVQVLITDDGKPADIGHSFSINCTVTVTEIFNNSNRSLTITYQWYKEERSLPGARVSSLYFSALSLLDSGSYVCEVFIRSNSLGHGIIRLSLPYKLNISSEYLV